MKCFLVKIRNKTKNDNDTCTKYEIFAKDGNDASKRGWEQFQEDVWIDTEEIT